MSTSFLDKLHYLVEGFFMTFGLLGLLLIVFCCVLVLVYLEHLVLSKLDKKGKRQKHTPWYEMLP